MVKRLADLVRSDEIVTNSGIADGVAVDAPSPVRESSLSSVIDGGALPGVSGDPGFATPNALTS